MGIWVVVEVDDLMIGGGHELRPACIIVYVCTKVIQIAMAGVSCGGPRLVVALTLHMALSLGSP